ncbi:multicopper oxidase family protein [Ramlibacter henchirensis]|uniref:multicopper oxidase family protein n=1 Tax=Ramlibacter henchirensis TaxID=204072 RepID=UPI001F0F0E93|nr:multicopper oxidase domain-containing protein [Ramlibacter henchirensis]
MKASLAAAPMVLTTHKAGAQVPVGLPPSPPTTPWVEELPLQDTPLAPVAAPANPYPTLAANIAGGECGRDPHQRYDELCGPGGVAAGAPLFYEMAVKQNSSWRFNGDNAYYPPQPIWGFEGINTPGAVSPGPTIHARYGKPIICRIHNGLPALHTGFGSPEINIHLHNMHTPSASDGFPGDFYSGTVSGPTLSSRGSFRDHFYPNLYAGFDEFGGIGDPREALGSLFYHDHTEGVTAPNVLRGLVGRYNIFDDLDTGDELTGLRLPSGPYDYPLTISDRRFDVNGQLTFNQLDPEGVLGDKIVVNGKIEPVLRVARRKYRFRLLNAGPTRYYELVLQNRSANAIYGFTNIANDGNLLPNPLLHQYNVRMAPAERADIVIDFAKFPLGTELYLVNTLTQTSTRRPDRVQAPGTRILKLVVDRNPPEPDMSRVPSVLRPLRPLPSEAELATLPVRRFNFERSGGMWAINARFFNVFTPDVTVPKGSAEIWEFFNANDGWQHPIHMHFEEGRILSKSVNGTAVPIPPNERGRKDVFNVGENMTVRVLFRFRDFTGKYPMHCHNLTHEDHSMMLRWDIV